MGTSLFALPSPACPASRLGRDPLGKDMKHKEVTLWAVCISVLD